jgi:hypothetical protein
MFDWIQGCGFLVLDFVTTIWRTVCNLVTEP